MTDIRTRRARERGVTLIAGGVWLMAMLAIVAIAVEIARLTDTATEVQAAADAGALAAALAIERGQSAQASTVGKNAAGSNFADGKLVPATGVQIDLGHYSTDPAVNPHFTTVCTVGTDCNAARATVTVTNVKYLMASILNGQASTSVQKKAVASSFCQGSATPFPLAVCSNSLTNISQDNVCGSMTASLFMNPNNAQNACWTTLTAGGGASSVQSLFPTQCGGSPVNVALKQSIGLTNGVSASLWNAFQCCVACQDIHDFIVPVVDCSAIGTCNTSPQVLGFATIHIANATDISLGNGNNTCGNSFSPWGSCGTKINNSGKDGITGSQVCKTALAGTGGGTTCTNYGNTVIPALGQLP